MQWLAVAVSAIATVTDLRGRRIPNLLTYPTFVLALGWHAIQGTWPGAFMAIAVATLLFFPVYWLGGVGGGDLKLALAIAAILGTAEDTLNVLLYTTLFGAGLALADAARKGQLRLVWQRLRSRQVRQQTTPLTIAYAPAFLLGTVAHAISRWPLGFS